MSNSVPNLFRFKFYLSLIKIIIQMKNTAYYTSIYGNLETTIQKALDNLKWKYEKNESEFKVNFTINLYTWGSIMKVEMANDKQCNIEIKPKVPTTVTDWGFGVNKIDELVKEIQRLEEGTE